MRSNLNGRSFVLAVALSALLSAACGKRSGLDRGDASVDLLDNQKSPAVNPGGDERASDDGAGLSEPRQFAAPPAGDTEEAAAAPEAVAPRAFESEGRAKSGAASSPSEPARKPAKSPMNQSAELSARDDGAYTAKSRQRDAYQPREERPGLGTSWGETRASRVHTVRFERDNGYTPTATQRIFYNDAQGVLAQTGQRSISSLGRNLTELGNGFVTVEIVDPDGDPLPGVIGGGRSYVVGRDGDRYAIRIRNHERYRVEVVATVDGLDVIDGTKGHFQKRGYVIDPYSSLLIEGFRKSKGSVASFRFGAVSDSYAARTSGDRNVGVIGIALFAERGCCNVPYSQHEIERRESADPFPGQYARPPRPEQPMLRRSNWME